MCNAINQFINLKFKVMIEKQFLFLFTFFILLLGSVDGFCGRNQVLINLQSLKQEFPLLNERYIASNNNFLMQINNQTSFNKLRIEFSLTIKGNGITITSNENLSGKSFDLSAYTSTILYATDLAPYFDAENLNFSGISKEDYLAGIPLPQGMYSICFDAKAYTSDAQYRPASTCTQLLLKVNDPPVIIMPKYNESVDVSKPYLFSWMPQHFATGITEYEFEIYEDVGVSIADLYNYYTPVYSTKTTLQSILLDNTAKYLNKNSKYICVVKVIQDENYSIPFKNNGYSNEIYFNTFAKRKKAERATPPTSCDYPKGTVFINEIANGNGNDNDEFVELVVVGSDVPGEYVSLWGYVLDDNNFNSANCGNYIGHVRLGRCFNRVKKGTIILIYSDAPGSIHPNINPANDGYDPNTGIFQIPFSAQCINKFDRCPNYQQNDTSYSCPPYLDGKELNWNKYIPMRNEGDVMQLRDINTSLKHAIRWVTNEYSYANSYKTLFKDQNVGNTYLAFTEGNNWYEADNYTFGPYTNATPGAPNSPDNEDLIETIRNANGAQPSISINCSQQNDYNGLKAKVEVTGSSGPYKVTINGTTFVTNLNPIIYGPLVPGTYRINVQDTISKCMDYCDLTITCNNVGKPCNDYNDCTINDVYNANCVCMGVPTDTVQFNVEGSGDDSLCQYCIIFDTCTHSYIYELSLNGITFADTNGNTIVLNQNTPGFDFSYAKNPAHWPNAHPLMNVISDFNQYMENNNYQAVMRYDTSEHCFLGRGLRNEIGQRMVQTGCYQSFIIDSTNLDFQTYNFSEYWGPNQYGGPYESDFNEPYCYVVPDHYTITASVDCEGELTYLWSNGATTPSIEIGELGECYSVTITCNNNGQICQFVGTFGENCECIIGAPCDDGDPCTSGGYYDVSCGCIESPLTDSDGDGICDEEDGCPGSDDNEDFDSDGIPDGCDSEIGCENLNVTINELEIPQGNCDYELNLDNLLNGNANILIHKITLEIPGYNNYEISGQQYGFPYCYGASNSNIEIPISNDHFDNSENWENTWNWIQGIEPYVKRVAQFANSQSHSIRLQDNEYYSQFQSKIINIYGFGNLILDYNFITDKFESEDKFLLEISYDSKPFELVKEYRSGIEFTNGLRSFETLNINVPANTSNLVLRFRNTTDGSIKRVYFDDIKIKKSVDACNIEGTGNALSNNIQNWLNDNSFGGVATFINEQNAGCSGTGYKIKITKSTIQFNTASASSPDNNNSYIQQFCSENCEGIISYGGSVIYSVESNCDNPTFEWSNGSVNDTIIVPKGPFYSVTVTCENGCADTLQIGDGKCVFGSPCSPGNCFEPESGYINEYCKCVGGIPIPGGDEDGDGLCGEDDPCPCDSDNSGPCDCLEPCPDKTILFSKTPVLGNFCDLCLKFGVENLGELKNCIVQVNGSNTPIDLTNHPTFHFPYCYEFNNTFCDVNGVLKKSLKVFIQDFEKWSLDNGFKQSFHIGRDSSCAGLGIAGMSVSHSDLVFVDLYFQNGLVKSYKNGCYQDTIGYNIKALTLPGCSPPSYLWGNGETDNQIFTPNKNAVYCVTITCPSGCVYEGCPSGCIIGTPCNDFNECTINEAIDINCNCVGTYADDSDFDGVCDPIDACPGFDDMLDDDNDGVPNACDTCLTIFKRVCSYCVDIRNKDCVRVKGFVYEDQGALVPVFLPEQNIGVTCLSGNSIFANEIQQWLLQNNKLGTASANNTNCQGSPGHSIKIVDTDVKFISLITLGASAQFVFTEFGCKQIVIPTQGAPCDDNDPCTINDVLDKNCTCKGTYVDSDHDFVCDAEDQCPGHPDYLDQDHDGVPDGCEDEFTIQCDDDKFVPACEYLINRKNCADESPSKLKQFDIIDIQNKLTELFSELNWEQENFDVGLVDDIHYHNDSDGDGIFDFFDFCNGQPSNSMITMQELVDCCNNIHNNTQLSIIASMLFVPVNWFENGHQPSCADELGLTLTEDTDGDLITVDSCEIDLWVDCSCKCRYKIRNDYDNDGICDPVDPIFGEECIVTCPSDPCTLYVVENCVCVGYPVADSDGDGVCDVLDVCSPSDGETYAPGNTPPQYNDLLDADLDGIPDCNDPCPVNLAQFAKEGLDAPSGPGDPCDDHDPCTFADAITNDCGCVGTIIDEDYDGVTECGECIIYFNDPSTPAIDWVEIDVHNTTLISCNGCYAAAIDLTDANGDGIPDKKCDVCESLSDMDDYNSNGLPDCLDPPYYPVACPSSIQVIPGQGFVLVFDSDEILLEDIPEPINFASSQANTSSGNPLNTFEYVLIDNIREAEGNFEVFYSAPTISGTNFSFLGVSYSNHQTCIVTDTSSMSDSIAYSDIICPSKFTVGATGLLIATFDYENMPIPDLFSLVGNMNVNLTSSSGSYSNIVGDFNLSIDNITTNSGSYEYNIPLGQFNGEVGNMNIYSGNILLPNGITCTYDVNGLQACVDPSGNSHFPGTPCDCDPTVMDCDCMSHFRYDNNCNCIGDPNPDSDGDGICDENDPCPNEVQDPVTGLCPCPALVLEAGAYVTINGGGDLLFYFNQENANLINDISVSIDGGPLGMDPIPNMTFTSPITIPNLPKGYGYVITFTANCLTGGYSSIDIPVDPIPFATDPGLCGAVFDSIDLATFSPLPNLFKDDIFTASDFEITVIESSGTFGTFTGKGYIEVPSLNGVRLNVTFTNIKISSAGQMVDGVVIVNGYGFALLGDPISGDINNIINNIINVLTDINDILIELTPLLESIEELVATTSQFVDPTIVNCIKNKAHVLDSLKLIAIENPNDPTIIDQIKVVTTELENCKSLYDEQLAIVMERLVQLMDKSISKIYLDCSANGNYLTQFNAENPKPEQWLNTRIDAIFSQFPWNGDGLDSRNEPPIYKEIKELSQDDVSNIQEIQDYYGVEAKHVTCLVVEDFNTNGGLPFSNPNDLQVSIGIIKNMLAVFLKAGKNLVEELSDELKSTEPIEDVYNNNKAYIDESYRKSVLQIIYKN